MKRKPPKPVKKPFRLETHGDVRIDDYYWLNDRENPDVLFYLQEEKKYFEQEMAHTKSMQEDLFQEMKGRIKEDDTSVPYFRNGYWYITRFEEGSEYPIYTRRKETMDAPEEILFNVNEMAKGQEYYHLRGVAISPDNRYASFGVDNVARRQYKISIKDLQTGEVLPETIENTTGSSAWTADSKVLFYTHNDEKTLRSDSIYRHQLGTHPREDVKVYEESDDTFHISVYKSKSKKYLVIGCHSTMTTEYHILPSDNPYGQFKLFAPRERGVEYSILHFEDKFYIHTNKNEATNFKLMVTPESKTEQENWAEFIEHREHVLLEDIDLFKNFYVLSERENGLSRLKICPWKGIGAYYIPFHSETYVAGSYQNLEFETDKFRYFYNSLNTPYSILEIDMATKDTVVLKEQEVPDHSFDKQNYFEKRLWATAEDGTKIPMSMVYHKDTPFDGSAPLFQYAYGSYGSVTEPYFSTSRLSLLNRGFIFVISHVRGSEYLGRHWYDHGKLLHKKNTFSDFIACSKYLIDRKYTSSDCLFAYGGSAGGLLMGVVANEAPQLYKGIIAAVPFVDVVTTMLDESIPLTTGEYDEWGNPHQKIYYDYMKSYSPYDNVKFQRYPNLYISSGFHDSQVQYFEPAKWVAKLREMKTDHNKVLFDIDLDTGHGGASGRFESLRELAREYAFILDLVKIEAHK